MARRSIARIVQVTIALSVFGALVGGVLSVILLALLTARSGGGGLRELLAFGFAFGATIGAVLAPLAAWTLMRHVPIWRAVSETAAGTVVGAGIGLILQPIYKVDWLSPVYLGLAGFALAGLRLRIAGRGRSRSDTDAPTGQR
jgi:hypothetical protein